MDATPGRPAGPLVRAAPARRQPRPHHGGQLPARRPPGPPVPARPRHHPGGRHPRRPGSFMADLLTCREPSTAATYHKVLKILYAWLLEEGEVPADPTLLMRPPIVPDKPVPIVPDDGLKRLFQACVGNSFESRRDTALIMLLLDTGARRDETERRAGHPRRRHRATGTCCCASAGRQRPASRIRPAISCVDRRWRRRGPPSLFTTQGGSIPRRSSSRQPRPKKARSMGLRASLHHLESEMGGTRCLDRACPP
jgi:integrase